ncbi:DUF998 domain-containing protein [Halosimplex salinum]|uniref:DUF998 domain-containing protein n=1 Tax=Halosimplex salinum TaxID=1710538 RepID=UPI000F4A9FDA|nr:DUF998 domain-containing protein [Halosimplex salinum]
MRDDRTCSGVGIAVCLSASALALAVAPLFMPEGYSWVTHTTSESAAQGLGEAWIARLGFLSFGLGVIWLAAERRAAWQRWTSVFHAGFGVFMVATAVFSTRSWDAAMPYSPVEDALHSVTATLLGFCFAFGVLTLSLRRLKEQRAVRWFDLFALGATVAVPAAMTLLAQFAGVFQRIMFLVAYVWYLREAYLLSSHSDRHTRPSRSESSGGRSDP